MSRPPAPSQAVVSINDDDTAGITLSKTGLNIDEGDQDTYTVVLNSQPTGNVTVTVSGHSGTDLTVSDTSLTFTTQNWETSPDRHRDSRPGRGRRTR